jgi:acetyl esterase/lipase
VALTRRTVPAAIAAALVVPAAVLALGTFVPDIPFLGTAGSWLFPTFAGTCLPVALAGVWLAVVAMRRGARRTGGVVAAIGVLTAAGACAILAQHVRVATANDVSVSLFATLVPRGVGTGARPDETRVYATIDGHDLNLDIYRPAAPSGATALGVPAPVAVHSHGGGWIRGDRTTQAANLRWLADHGYLAVSLDYVLATPETATWDTAASQIACGLSWIRAQAATLGGDPGRVFVFGESAGGALALTTAYAAAAGGATSSCGGPLPRVRAVAAEVPALDPVTFYDNPDPLAGRFARRMVREYLGGTPMDYPDRAAAVAAASYITPTAPPTFLLLSDDDHLVPIGGAVAFIDRARQAGVMLRIVRFPRADHGVASQYYSIANQVWLQVMQQHFCRYGGACP